MSAESGRLLIVDDERDFAAFIGTIAQEVGFLVRAVERSREFERYLAEWNPTVVFLDIFMPERDGLEVLGSLERLAYDGHLVVMSGADPLYLQMAANSAKARGLRLSSVLTKPCRKNDVADLLRSLTPTST